ncbi:MAG: C-terminal binding protein [Lachnospiraceae bacterium]|nr:C-terminal binding protein [Lachnospiraceae bacterium]
MRIVLFAYQTTPHIDEWKKAFSANGVPFDIAYDASDDNDIVNACKDADVAVTLITPFRREVLGRIKSVKRIVIAAMGCDCVDVKAAEKLGIEVLNIPDYAVEEVAVHQMALMLASLRHINIYSDYIKAGKWTDPDFALDFPVHRLSGLTYGLIGFGRIAKKVCTYLHAFGMKVIAYDPYVPAEEITISKAQPATLDEVLSSSDVISPNLPLTAESRHMIGRRQFDAMKPGVVIVNTGRGAVIDHEALCEAIGSGKVSAFACDVFENEPFNDMTSPLMKSDRCIMTPHIAYLSEESMSELISKTVSAALYGSEDAENAKERP